MTNLSLRATQMRTVHAAVGTERTRLKPIVSPNIPKLLKSVKPKLAINGKFVDSISGRTYPLIDPRTEETILQVAEADAADIDCAVAAARKAFEEGHWPKMSGRARGRLLFKLADLLESCSEELAQLETLNNGMPLMISRMENIPGAIGHLRYFAGCADKTHGKTIPVDGEFLSYTLREPKGVVGQITAWNFPLLAATWKIAPALAAGNSIVLKCSEQTPLSALRVAELALEAGIPPGVLNVVPGFGPTAGAALASHLDVDKIAFTGSTEVGQKIMQMASVNIKDITLELGGKSPLIIFPDADLEQAAQLAHFALFFNQGQICNSGSRVFVHSSVYDKFIDMSVDIARNKIVGDPFCEVDQGPLNNKNHFDNVLGYIERGKQQGAELACGGSRIGDKGYYIEPTVFANVQDEMKIAREEIFGPVQSVFKFDETDEVVHRANDTPLGLVAGIITKDLDLANQVSRALRAGSVWVNCFHVTDDALPFGGYKMSGIGREKGQDALDQYTQIKTVTTTLKNPAWL